MSIGADMVDLGLVSDIGFVEATGGTEGFIMVQWPIEGLVCAKGFDNRDAGVICRSMRKP